MIIENGTIEIKTKTGGGLDPATGYPSPAQVSWGAPVPCQYTASRFSFQGKTSQGEHTTTASYTILIEERPFQAEQIRLKDRESKVVGEFSIIQVEPLEAVGEIRITV